MKKLQEDFNLSSADIQPLLRQIAAFFKRLPSFMWKDHPKDTPYRYGSMPIFGQDLPNFRSFIINQNGGRLLPFSSYPPLFRTVKTLLHNMCKSVGIVMMDELLNLDEDEVRTKSFYIKKLSDFEFSGFFQK